MEAQVKVWEDAPNEKSRTFSDALSRIVIVNELIKGRKSKRALAFLENNTIDNTKLDRIIKTANMFMPSVDLCRDCNELEKCIANINEIKQD